MYNHVAIPVIDPVQSQKFYEIIGFTKTKSWQKPEQNLSAIIMEKEGFILELIHHPENIRTQPLPLVAMRHLGVSVKNISELLQTLEKDGFKTLQPITQGVSVKEFAFVEDPNGWAVELVVEK